MAPVDYARPETLVAALRGQDALVVTLGVSVPEEVHRAVVRAAADAGVPWVLPNEWGADTDDEGTRRDLPMWERNSKPSSTSPVTHTPPHGLSQMPWVYANQRRRENP